MAESHSGQTSGIRKGLVCSGLFSFITVNTSGITSPALCTITVSPTLTSFLSISSRLWRVALSMVTPPTDTGSSMATGVIAPVLPTPTAIAMTLVDSCFGANLYASAHLGLLVMTPSLSWRSRLLTFKTAPSTS